jgi:hypothetical protein
MAWLKRIWGDSVGANVIAAGIFALISLVGSYFLNLWPMIWGGIRSAWQFIQSTTTVPNWLLGLLALCGVLVIFVLAALLWGTLFQKNKQPPWNAYITDSFFGIRWHWRYDANNSIVGLYACCEACAYQMHPQYQGGYAAAQQIYYQCDMCGRNHGPHGDDQFAIENKVKRHIQQKLRTGSWISTTPKENA